jgi:hypothetical protein
MTGIAGTFATNVRWELRRLRRSQRIFLLAIPPVAGPVGSAIADLYLHVPSTGTAILLGLLITAGLAALVLLDLTALAVGEELALRAHLVSFPLPQRRSAALAGRLFVVVGGSSGAYAVGAGLVGVLGGALVAPGGVSAPLFDPAHLFLAVFGLLLGLAGVVAATAVMSQTASEALVAGVLAGVVFAALAGYLIVERTLSAYYPLLLGVGGLAALGWAVARYPDLEA